MSESDSLAERSTAGALMRAGGLAANASVVGVAGVSQLISGIGIAYKPLFQEVDRMTASMGIVNRLLANSFLNWGVVNVMRAFDQQWAKQQRDWNRQANLMALSTRTIATEMNMAVNALANSASLLSAMPKAHAALPRVDTVSIMRPVITRSSRSSWSDAVSEEDDPLTYSDVSLDATLLNTLEQSHYHVSTREFRESFRDLHREPYPDLTGAISHANAGFLSVARAIDGNSGANPREIVARHRDLFPKPLDEAVLKHWGFSSQYGRKVSEGKIAEYHQAEAAVYGIALITLSLVRGARKAGLITHP